jgi:hypothetical protein
MYNNTRGWVSQAGLMPGYVRQGGNPVPVPPDTVVQSQPPYYPNGEPPYRGGPVSPDYDPRGSYAMQGIPAPVPQAPRQDRVTEGQQEFVCQPNYDPQDHNPPTNIVVQFYLEHGVVTNMEVAYDLQHGERVYRSRQYRATILHDNTVLAGWQGTYVKDARKTMAGGLYYGRDGKWYYREKQWSSGRVDYDYTALCNMVDLP